MIDGTGQTLMPGLVEPSCHLSFPSSVDRIVREFRPPRERHQFHTAHNAKVLLDNGYTSAFSGGATSPAIEVVVRDEVAGSWIHGQGLTAAAFERAIGNLDHLARQPC